MKAMKTIFVFAAWIAIFVSPFNRAAGAEPKLLAEFTTASGGEPILLPVTMGGKTYSFLLDTGANRTTFDKKLEPLLGPAKEIFQAKMADGQVNRMSVYFAPNASVGPLSLQQAGAVFCVDLSNLREATGLPIDGVLGNTFLRRYAVQIDFDAGKVRFYEAGKPEASWGLAVPMEILPNGVPVIVVDLAGDVQNVMLVDSGYSDTGMIPAELFDHLRKEKKVPVAVSKHLGTDGTQTQTLAARVDELRLGKNRYAGLTFDRSEGEVSLLGLGFLSRHTVTFDFLNDKLYLKKGKRYDLPDEIDMSGLHLLQKPNGVVVHSIDAGSPAEKAGLKPRDILRQIDNQNVREMTLSNLRQRLRAGDGKTVDIIFQRGDKGFKTTLTLKKQI
ncbi:MAG: aspartyl protease family protein [Phycisphaerae bacterium]|nr:aspartyl protease family protein [Phycisphaerae bacterium]